MSETIEEFAQRMLDTRGYLVMCSFKEHANGEVIEYMTSFRGEDVLNHKTVVIEPTNFEDVVEQCRQRGRVANHIEGTRYYRVIAE